MARLYVGGVGRDVKALEIKEIFDRAAGGQDVVAEVDIRSDASGMPRGFAYVSMADPESAARCVKLYNKAVWRGGRLKVEHAQETYMARLEREWAEARGSQRPAVISEGEQAPRDFPTSGGEEGRDTQSESLPTLSPAPLEGRSRYLRVRRRAGEKAWVVDTCPVLVQEATTARRRPRRRGVKLVGFQELPGACRGQHEKSLQEIWADMAPDAAGIPRSCRRPDGGPGKGGREGGREPRDVEDREGGFWEQAVSGPDVHNSVAGGSCGRGGREEEEGEGKEEEEEEENVKEGGSWEEEEEEGLGALLEEEGEEVSFEWGGDEARGGPEEGKGQGMRGHGEVLEEGEEDEDEEEEDEEEEEEEEEEAQEREGGKGWNEVEGTCWPPFLEVAADMGSEEEEEGAGGRAPGGGEIACSRHGAVMGACGEREEGEEGDDQELEAQAAWREEAERNRRVLGGVLMDLEAEEAAVLRKEARRARRWKAREEEEMEGLAVFPRYDPTSEKAGELEEGDGGREGGGEGEGRTEGIAVSRPPTGPASQEGPRVEADLEALTDIYRQFREGEGEEPVPIGAQESVPFAFGFGVAAREDGAGSEDAVLVDVEAPLAGKGRRMPAWEAAEETEETLEPREGGGEKGQEGGLGLRVRESSRVGATRLFWPSIQEIQAEARAFFLGVGSEGGRDEGRDGGSEGGRDEGRDGGCDGGEIGGDVVPSSVGGGSSDGVLATAGESEGVSVDWRQEGGRGGEEGRREALRRERLSLTQDFKRKRRNAVKGAKGRSR
ncbi:hypothetical protein NSK_002516 [Nannochloropsis salina CCMP1776]|uniref:RRM domain-containing protein n=1 Tax=Nannochloropsis salina CCMP1776 TaxID=1027361 RepID=A0A4D9DCF0_9STRA|nr:hypothetical protein NSK_002516 [Nannochloropsis salina CCMP1776]|eukprot:TFJ86308.1 hypothetical protein NSK_002516 [Nannochloropsis salina CCMP1776]